MKFSEKWKGCENYEEEDTSLYFQLCIFLLLLLFLFKPKPKRTEKKNKGKILNENYNKIII